MEPYGTESRARATGRAQPGSTSGSRLHVPFVFCRHSWDKFGLAGAGDTRVVIFSLQKKSCPDVNFSEENCSGKWDVAVSELQLT